MQGQPTTYQLTYAALVALQADDSELYDTVLKHLDAGYSRAKWLLMLDIRRRMHERGIKIIHAQDVMLAIIGNQPPVTRWYTGYDGIEYAHAE